MTMGHHHISWENSWFLWSIFNRYQIYPLVICQTAVEHGTVEIISCAAIKWWFSIANCKGLPEGNRDIGTSSPGPYRPAAWLGWRTQGDGTGEELALQLVQGLHKWGEILVNSGWCMVNIRIIYMYDWWFQPTPLKNRSSSVGMMTFPTEWRKNTCSKPPTRSLFWARFESLVNVF